MFASLALFKRLAAAHHGNDAVVEQTMHLLQHDFVRFAEIFTAFGVTHDAEIDFHGSEHFSGNFTCIGTVLELAHILQTSIKLAAFIAGMVGDQLGINSGRTENHLSLKLIISQLFFNIGNKVFGFFEVLVHFPVTDNNFRFCHNINI